MDSKQRCETCKWFSPKSAPGRSYTRSHHTCENPALEMDINAGEYVQEFMPPSPDFGCNLWKGVTIQPAPLLEPYDWGPGGVPEGQPLHYEPGYGWKVGEDE